MKSQARSLESWWGDGKSFSVISLYAFSYHQSTTILFYVLISLIEMVLENGYPWNVLEITVLEGVAA
ncbi:MAG: hypothetical protein HXS53_04050 [Theionarchaea archaeon]|nr:hypothetical protein [Theionarchaea archaeon]